jgi:hypothetical protein
MTLQASPTNGGRVDNPPAQLAGYPRPAQRKKTAPHTMSDDELIAVLEEIVRDETAPASARVTAIRTLWEWRHAEPEEKPTGFDDLYGDDLTAGWRERTWRFPVHPGLLKGKPHAAGLPQTRYRSRG